MDETVKNKYLKDIDYFSKRLEEDPGSKVFMPLALAYLKLGKYDEVIEICSKGLDANPDYVAPKTVLAQAYLGKGMINEAKGLLIEVAAINKDNYKANKLLGDIYRAEDNIDKAINHYRTALMISPEDVQLREMVNELAETTEAKPAEDEPQTEEIQLDSDEDVADLADELAEELRESGHEEEDDLFYVAEEIDKLIEKEEYEKAREYARDNIRSEEILEKKLKEIEAYEQGEPLAEEGFEVEIPDDQPKNEEPDFKEGDSLVSDDDISKLLAEGANDESVAETGKNEQSYTDEENSFVSDDDIKGLLEKDSKDEGSEEEPVESEAEKTASEDEEWKKDTDFIEKESENEQPVDDFTKDNNTENSEQVIPGDKKEVVEKLEKWLDNIRKVKKDKDV